MQSAKIASDHQGLPSPIENSAAIAPSPAPTIPITRP